MPSGDCQLGFFDAFAFVGPFPRNLLGRGRVWVMHAARRIGADFDNLSALAAVHHDGFGHLLARLLDGRQLRRGSVGLGFLDLEFHVVVAPQGSALARVPRRRNLYQLRLAFECLRYVNVELVTKALGVNTAVLLDIGKK